MYERNYILGLSGDRSLLLDVLQMHGHRIADVYVPQEAYEVVGGGDGKFRQRYKNLDPRKPDTFLDHDVLIAQRFGVRFLVCSLSDHLPSSQENIVLDYRRLPGKEPVLSSLTHALSVFD